MSWQKAEFKHSVIEGLEHMLQLFCEFLESRRVKIDILWGLKMETCCQTVPDRECPHAGGGSLVRRVLDRLCVGFSLSATCNVRPLKLLKGKLL